ncbi:MAG: class I SAM-dependent methyltransferase [Patescibacteria group bacterium]
MKKFLQKMYCKAAEYNRKNILSVLDTGVDVNFLDLGCDDGRLTIRTAEEIGTNNVYGVEIVEDRIRAAEQNGLLVKCFDLNKTFDFEDNYFDAVHANQVIEHLYDSDNFISEIYRVLKIGGYAVISTENASSWCNIFASIMGWQIFSLTNFSGQKRGIGNPFALRHGNSDGLKSWTHIRIYNIRGLKEYFESYNFKVEEIRGAGYFPFPAFFGNFDKTHSHFMTFKIRKI